MKAYLRYRDYDWPWISRLPAHWRTRRVGYLFSERREKVSDSDFPALSVTMSGIVPQIETAAKTDDGDNRKLVRAGDFVINSRSDRKGSSGLSTRDGSVSLISTVLTPSNEISGTYAHHLLRSVAFQEEFYRNGQGIVADLWSTPYNRMRDIWLPLPSMDEQLAIAAFLDRETAKIDGLIAEQERLIALLRERRQAVISQAVTTGLDPNVPMLDSGIDWLGRSPKHWEVVRLSRIVEHVASGTSVNSVDIPAGEGQIGVLKTSAVYGGVFRPEENKSVLPEEEDSVSCPVRANTLIVSRINTPEHVGAAGLCTESRADLFLPDRLWSVTFRDCDPAFVYTWTRSAGYRAQVERACTGASSSMQNISRADFLGFLMPFPPSAEQTVIAQALEASTKQIDEAIGLAIQASGLLNERRLALITAAVTGQIDVRGLADAA